jgi:DNA-binding NarL/FixJ family response regulator
VQSPRVVVVDDHDVFRNGLISLLTEQGIDVVGDTPDGEEAIRLVARLAPVS